MITKLKYAEPDMETLTTYLKEVDHDFGIPLSSKVCLKTFAEKLLRHGHVYIVRNGHETVGMVGFYSNDQTTHTAHLPILSVKAHERGKGHAKLLIKTLIDECLLHGMETILCNSVNTVAVSLYQSFGFKIHAKGKSGDLFQYYMEKKLKDPDASSSRSSCTG